MRELEEEYLKTMHEYHELTKNGLYSKIWKWWGYGLVWFVIWFSSMLLAALPITRLYFTAKIHEYKAVQQTINNIRKTPQDNMELRGIGLEIARWNGWVDFWRTWDSVPIVDFYIPNDINYLQPME
jgi:hypothetical protein